MNEWTRKTSGFAYLYAVSGNGATFNAIVIAFFRDIKRISKQKGLLVPSLQKINQTDTNEKEIK